MNLTLDQLEKLVNDYQHDNHDGYVSNTKDWIENWVKDRLPVILDELVCDNCGSHPKVWVDFAKDVDRKAFILLKQECSY